MRTNPTTPAHAQTGRTPARARPPAPVAPAPAPRSLAAPPGPRRPRPAVQFPRRAPGQKSKTHHTRQCSFEHSIYVHVFSIGPHVRLGAGTRKVFGYGLIRPGVVVGQTVARDGSASGHTSVGFSTSLGGGVQSLVGKRIMLGGETALTACRPSLNRSSTCRGDIRPGEPSARHPHKSLAQRRQLARPRDGRCRTAAGRLEMLRPRHGRVVFRARRARSHLS